VATKPAAAGHTTVRTWLMPSAAEIRASLGHPVIDGDGHLLEPTALLHEYLAGLVGGKTARRIMVCAGRQVSMGDARNRRPRTGWWLTPNNARDIATAMAPSLRSERQGELGIDFSFVYPSAGLVLASLTEDEFRLAGVRAVNAMNADLCRDYSRHLAVAALIPMHTPSEAVNELEYARNELDLKVAVIPPLVARPVEAFRAAFPQLCWLDSYALDSAYDYDIVWSKFAELGMAVTSHGAVADCVPFGRSSPSNFVFNHIGAHSFQQEHLCKSLVLGGVLGRFPQLNFAFLECGALWACDLVQALADHYGKRGPAGIRRLDPSLTDRAELARLLDRHGGPAFAVSVPFSAGRPHARRGGEDSCEEFRRSGVNSSGDLIRAFERMFFGSEADDRGAAVALNGKDLFGTRIKAMFSSDIGHWDVPDTTEVLPESYELVQHGALAAPDYQDFVFRNAVMLHGQMNPGFFSGTTVEDQALEVLRKAMPSSSA
jgi:predicted TIM-barrel fold metal-dependent hydrolase